MIKGLYYGSLLTFYKEIKDGKIPLDKRIYRGAPYIHIILSASVEG
jgi:hypothetical protein